MMSEKRYLFNFSRIGVSAYRSDIGPENDRYMLRWVFRTPLGMIRIHKILRSDADEAWHDHPGWLLSFVLKGGYDEYVPYIFRDDGEAWVFYSPLWALSDLAEDSRPFQLVDENANDYYAGDFNFIPANKFHRIELNRSPTWTLVLMGPIRKRWGFLSRSEEYTDFETYLQQDLSSTRSPKEKP